MRDLKVLMIRKWFAFAGGEIKVFIEYKDEPLAVYTDRRPLAVKYFGFASYDNSLAKYFYDCPGEYTYDVTELAKRCNQYEESENQYKKFFPISEIEGIRPDGYIIKFPVFIHAESNAHILLSPKNRDDRSDDVYEICNSSSALCLVIIC